MQVGHDACGGSARMDDRIGVSVKTFILAILEFIGSLLPDKVWRVAFKIFLRNKRLMDLYGMHYVGEFASRMNIVRISTIGDYGIFSSAPNDKVIFRQYAKSGKWAANTNLEIRNFFAGGRGTYLDIGANIGLTVVPLAAAHSDVKCFAFEPDPTNFRHLQLNIFENVDSKNISVYQLALFDRAGTLSFELAPGNLGDHRIRWGDTNIPGRLGEDKRQVIETQCARLDDLSLPVQGPFLVKIDTQGAEPFVFAGGYGTLAKADIILLEWAPYLMERMNGNPRVVIEFLREKFLMGKIRDAESEHDEAEFQPIQEICEALTGSLVEWSGDPSKYVDVVVTRIAVPSKSF
jgi:FkbM family methyltransferase